MAEVQASRRETIAECERVLTAIHQKLADQDETSAHIERCILEVLGEAARRKAAHKEVAEAPAPAPIVSTRNTAPNESAPQHGVFDAADETFVRQLIGEPDKPQTTGTGREDPVFDAEDDEFVRRLIAQSRDAARKDTDDTQEDS
jgi:hypothetical protein